MNNELSSIVDITATRVAYHQFRPHGCECAYCRNFRAQFQTRIDGKAESLLYSFGIDPQKPNEIIEFGKSQSGRIYQVEWAFLIASHAAPFSPIKLPDIANLDIWAHAGGIPNRDFDVKNRRWSICIQWGNVPWILAEPEPD